MQTSPLDRTEGSSGQLQLATWRDELLCKLVPHVVHRLGNLLTVVMGTADLLALDEQDAARRDELASVGAHARGATDLIRALGSHARSMPGEPTALDLRDLLSQQAGLFSPIAKAAGCELDSRPPAGVTVARADPASVQLLLIGVFLGLAAPAEGLAQREGRLSVRAVGLGRRAAILISMRVTRGEPAREAAIDARAMQLAGELGVSLRERRHPDGHGRSLLLGFAALA